jgi:hypothetical protein
VAVGRPGRAEGGEFVADELSLMLREQPYPVRCLIAPVAPTGSGAAHRLAGLPRW